MANNSKVVGRPFKKGNKGRPPGTQNKLTRTVKETVLAVFDKIQSDPKIKLEQFAKDYPRDFYNIAAKLIPIELSGNIDHVVKVQIVRGKSNIK